MIENSKTYSYGPVPSRRLGKSLGINNIPAKVCTYSCVYCQVGKTTRKQHERLKAYRAYLTTPSRPPAENWVRSVDEDVLNRMFHIFSAKVKQVEYLIGYEGNAFAFTGDIESDLLSITAVHPMRKEAVDALLSRAGSSWQVVEQLVDRGDLVKTCYDGHESYLRKFTQKNTGPDLLSLFKPIHV